MSILRSNRILLLVILLVTSTLAAPSALGEDAPRPAPAIALYADTGADSNRYLPLDPQTLADRPDAAPFPIPDDPSASWLLSADGSTMVEALYPSEGDDGEGNPGSELTFVIRDGLNGPERLRFVPPEPSAPGHLSADGTRLVTWSGQNGGESGVTQPTWYSFDTRTGELLATIPGEGQGFGPYGFHTALVDPAARRLYRPFVPGDRAAAGPLTLNIAVNDLETGAEIARVDLTDIPAGSWWNPRIDQVPVNGVLAPALALSPDGARLAIAHADSDRLTLLDAATLEPVRTLALTHPRSTADRVRDWFGWLSFAPQDAAAKVLDGRVLDAVFAPDGRHLYLFGNDGTPGDTVESSVVTGLGLRVVDLESGEIIAEALAGEVIDQIIPTPDGRDLYALGPDVPWAMANGAPAYTLRRLDATTLTPLATREFPTPLRVLLFPPTAIS